jgi:hypothetical protein
MADPAHSASTTLSVGPQTRSDGPGQGGPQSLNVPGRREACLRDALGQRRSHCGAANYSSLLGLFVTQEGRAHQ